MTGTVKFFNVSKGFGFITNDETGEDMFVHSTSLDGITIKEGDKVILFDSNYTIKEIAKSCNTSEYEMLSKLNRRIKREYYS